MKLYLINYVKVEKAEFEKSLHQQLLGKCGNKYAAFVECWRTYCRLTVDHTALVGDLRFNIRETDD